MCDKIDMPRTSLRRVHGAHTVSLPWERPICLAQPLTPELGHKDFSAFKVDHRDTALPCSPHSRSCLTWILPIGTISFTLRLSASAPSSLDPNAFVETD